MVSGTATATAMGVTDKSGQSGHRSFWESPRRGAYQAAQQKRACKGGREVRIRVSDGPATARSGCPCSIAPRAG